MTGFKYTEESCSSMQISIKGSHGQRLISSNLLSSVTRNLFFFFNYLIDIFFLNMNYRYPSCLDIIVTRLL